MSKSLSKNAFLNIVKTVCQVIFPIITIPYISRTLGTVNYGKVNYTASIISYFALLASFGINNYATREGARVRGNKDKLDKLVNQLFTINILTSIFSLAILIMVVFGVVSNNDNKILLLIQGITIFFTAIGADWVNTIFEDYKYITIRYICVQFFSLFLLLVLVKTKTDFIIYAAILTLANSGANLFNIFYIRKYVHLKLQLTSELMQHIKPMLVLAGYSLTLTVYVNSDTTLLGIIKGDEDVGIYSIAAKIYLVVKQILNAGIMVSVPRIAFILGNGDKKAYQKLLNSIFDYLLVIVLPSMVGLFAMSDEIVLLVAGEEYFASSNSLKILSIALCFAVFACYFSNCFLLPNKKDKNMFIATLSGCVLNFGLNLFLIPKYSYIGASITTLLAELTVYLVCMFNSRNIEIVKMNKKNIMSIIVGCMLIVVVCTILKKLIIQVVFRTILSILLSILVYVLVLAICKNTVVTHYLKK